MKPAIRTDIVDVYVVRPAWDGGFELLQMRRRTIPLIGTWQPVIGHLEPDETAEEGAVRELGEETGLNERSHPGFEFGALPGVHPYFLDERNEIVMSARFFAIAPRGWSPDLNEEHDDARWVMLDQAPEHCHWPDQAASVRELRSRLQAPDRTP